MFKILTIVIVAVFILVSVGVGYALVPEKASSDSTEIYQLHTARCFEIGSLRSYAKCTINGKARLSGLDLIDTIVQRINRVLYPFGFLLIISLTLMVGIFYLLI